MPYGPELAAALSVPQFHFMVEVTAVPGSRVSDSFPEAVPTLPSTLLPGGAEPMVLSLSP